MNNTEPRLTPIRLPFILLERHDSITMVVVCLQNVRLNNFCVDVCGPIVLVP